MQSKNTTPSNPLNSGGRSQTELIRWGGELLIQNGLSAEHGFHVVVWEHDEGCPLHPDAGGDASSRCRCQPDGTLVLHVGMPEQREVDVVRDGIPLPIRPGEVAIS